MRDPGTHARPLALGPGLGVTQVAGIRLSAEVADQSLTLLSQLS